MTKNGKVLELDVKPGNPEQIEIIDPPELAKRLGNVPPSWVRQHCGQRYPLDQRIPCMRIGRYLRFRWNSPELNAWLKSLETR